LRLCLSLNNFQSTTIIQTTWITPVARAAILGAPSRAGFWNGDSNFQFLAEFAKSGLARRSVLID
jgi:hypothetical protein